MKRDELQPVLPASGFPPPDYDSGWTPIAPGGPAVLLLHGLGGDHTKYVIDLIGRSAPPLLNIGYYGGTREAGDQRGAYWFDLSNAQVYVLRLANDVGWPEFRLKIWIHP